MVKNLSYEERVKRILPEPKPIDSRSFFQRNGTLLLGIVGTLVALCFYVRWYVLSQLRILGSPGGI